MWRATRVSADAAQHMQVDAGLLVKTFNIANPVAPTDANIVCATSGDFSITCEPETEDFFEDVNNAPNNTMEGKRITGWNCELGITCLEITEDTLVLALGAADVDANGAVNPRVQYRLTDFKSLYWLGDMVDEDKLFVIAMDNTVSTGGLSFTSTKNGKGGLELTLTPHASLANMDKVPMAFYVLEKVDGSATEYTYTAVEPVGSENPKTEGWYVLVGDQYRPTNDTEVDENVTYYERS